MCMCIVFYIRFYSNIQYLCKRRNVQDVAASMLGCAIIVRLKSTCAITFTFELIPLGRV